MYGTPGHAYVYGVYGMHTCLNVVAGPAGHPSAILLRAAVPLAGADAMREARLARAVATRRADRRDPLAAAARLDRVPDARLATGPGNLAAAFGVALDDDGTDLLDPAGSLRLEVPAADGAHRVIVATPRIGVAYAGPGWADRPWRFVLDAGVPGRGSR
jgi:DNA-3-methyladenine glycosylase